MPSVLLSIASRILLWPFVVLSITVLYRGHNLPGGGFIGGLIAAFPFILIMLADGVKEASRRLVISPITLLCWGLSIAVLSGLLASFASDSFMTGLWLPGFTLPILGKVHLGTPLLFDVGVYLTVVGFTLAVIFKFEDLE
ncbi:MAG: MnhB domain-containing protein [Verrucomicrobiota bacterium]